LLPYLLACAQESAETGLPILRPMVLEYPNEPRIDTIDDQYLLGPDLLVAPVFQQGVKSRVVYFPKGQWWLYDRPDTPHPKGLQIQGPGFHEVEAPLERLPLYARAGAVLPRYKQPPQHLKGPAPKEWLLDIYPGDSVRQLTINEPGYTIEIKYRCENSAGRLEILPAPASGSLAVAVRLIERQPSFLRAVSGTIQPGDGQATFTINPAQGAVVEFRT
jgi:alpha-glucosidase (family GH31 glycosyl hydrolase)